MANTNQCDKFTRPLEYVDELSRKKYYLRARSEGLRICAVGALLLLLDFIWFTISSVAGVNAGSVSPRGDGLSLIFLTVVFGTLPYGIYRIATVSRYAARYALEDLMEHDRVLMQYYESLQAKRDSRRQKIYLNIIIASLAIASLSVVFIALLAVSLLKQ